MLFSAWVGLRPGELFALKWSTVRGDTLHINSSLISTGEVTRPKNGKKRKVVLPPQAVQALREMPRRADSDYIFTVPSGRPFSKTSHYYDWRALRLAAGLPNMDYYELRHFAATWLLEHGVLAADVAVQLGHTDGGALVLDTYGHPSEDAARERLRGVYGAHVGRLTVVRD